MASTGDAKETIYNKKNNSLSGTRRLLCGIGNQTHHISAEAPWPRWDFLERTNAMSDDELGYDRILCRSSMQVINVGHQCRSSM